MINHTRLLHWVGYNMGPLSLYRQFCRNQSDSTAETDLTLSSSSVRSSLVRWSTASSISESSRRPERQSVSVRFNTKLNFHVSAVHCALTNPFVVPAVWAQTWLWSADWRYSQPERRTPCCTEMDGRQETHSLLLWRGTHNENKQRS